MPRTRFFLQISLALSAFSSSSFAETAANADYDSAPQLEAIEAEAETDHYVQGPFLPDVQGTKINIGKKTTLIDLDAVPRIDASNYRLALIQAPGLILSEEASPLLSIGYRGLEPHRTQYTQVLADGIPIHADQFGYPEAYYVPPLDTVDRIEFHRGAGSLMFGPQPGGALNYVTHRPSFEHAFGGATTNTFGEDGAWNSFSYVDGTVDRVGYYVYYNHRETDGFRAANSDVKLNAGTVKLALDADGARRWFLTLASYQEAHGEPGGLGFGTGINDVNYQQNRNAASRLFDRFELDRDAATLTLEQDLPQGQLSARMWAVDYTRYSRRQRGGGFGVRPNGANANSNDIETQAFDTFGLEARYRRDWGQNNTPHVFAIGAQVFNSNSPRTDVRGAAPDARVGVLRIASERDMRYRPVFMENLFRFGRFSITPGVRFESYDQKVATQFVNPTGTTRMRDETTSVTLFGLGSSWDFSKRTRAYFNISESYRPIVFTEAVPNSTTTVVSADLEEGRAWQADLGLRSRSVTGLTLDASLFYMQFKDKIGGAGTVSDPIQNIGEIKYRGIEASAEYNFLAALEGDNLEAPQLNVLFNLTLLDAEISADSNAARIGNSPQYAPDYSLRTGLIYRVSDQRKLALLGTFVDDSFADDANSAERFMPSYQIWDLTGEWQLGTSKFVVLGGITNLFDEKYFARIRNDGIDPAAGRSWYAGLKVGF